MVPPSAAANVPATAGRVGTPIGKLGTGKPGADQAIAAANGCRTSETLSPKVRRTVTPEGVRKHRQDRHWRIVLYGSDPGMLAEKLIVLRHVRPIRHQPAAISAYLLCQGLSRLGFAMD